MVNNWGYFLRIEKVHTYQARGKWVCRSVTETSGICEIYYL